MQPDPPPASCCDGTRSCVFSKALLAHAASCAKSQRRALAEHECLECGSPVARINCSTLAALLHERARFALKLPPAGRPLMHVQALRLHCGGLAALGQLLGSGRPDVHEMVREVQAQHGSLQALPWEQIVPTIAAWQPRRRSGRLP